MAADSWQRAALSTSWMSRALASLRARRVRSPFITSTSRKVARDDRLQFHAFLFREDPAPASGSLPNPVAPWELRIGVLRVYYDVEEEPVKLVAIRAVGVKKRGRLFIGGEEIEL